MDEVPDDEIAQLSFEYRTAISMKYWWSAPFIDNKPRMSIATNSSGSDDAEVFESVPMVMMTPNTCAAVILLH